MLCGICLPGETRELWVSAHLPEGSAGPDPRRLFPARDWATPFYVHEQGAHVGKTGERLVVTKEREIIGEIRLIESVNLLEITNQRERSPRP